MGEKFAKLRLSTYSYPEYGDGKERGPLFTGFLIAELTRMDPSLGVFYGVHTGLAMGSIYLCGDEEQRRR